jgi:hypothetical protein
MPNARVRLVANGSSRTVKVPPLWRKPWVPLGLAYSPTIWSVSLRPKAWVVPAVARGSSKVL